MKRHRLRLLVVVPESVEKRVAYKFISHLWRPSLVMWIQIQNSQKSGVAIIFNKT